MGRERGSGQRKDPVAGAATALRYHLTDCGVAFALDCAARGEQVVYASDWSPGTEHEAKLRAAGVELHTGLRRSRG